MVKSIKKILKSTDGETLLESIASLLIFVVLLLAVTSMIATSLKITTYASSQYKVLRQNVTKIDMATVTYGSGTVKFKSDGVGNSVYLPDQKVLEIGSKNLNNMDILAFAPYYEG